MNQIPNNYHRYRNKLDLVGVFFSAVLVRLILLILSVEQIGFETFWSTSIDTVNYFKIAEDFLNSTNNAESFLFTFGPGFGAFLALIISIFGHNIFLILLANIFISAISCCLIYLLATSLFNDRIISLIASYLMVLSYTAISLSCIILSDTLFFFLFLFSLLLFVRGFNNMKLSYFALSGVLMSYAILVRSIGQLWFVPFVVIMLSSLSYDNCKSVKQIYRKNSAIINRAALTITIILIVIISSSIRNYKIHNVFAITSTASGGMANVAAYTCEKMGGQTLRETRNQWYIDFMNENNLESISDKQRHEINQSMAQEVFFNHPLPMISAYISLAWSNVNDINSFNRILLPENKRLTIGIEHFVRRYKLNYLGFFFTIAGLLVMIVKKQYKATTILGLVYFYYFIMIGSYYWQGSRLFFPAEIASSIVIAFLIVYSFQYLHKLFKST